MTDGAPSGGETRPPNRARPAGGGGTDAGGPAAPRHDRDPAPGADPSARPNLSRGLAYGIGMAIVFVLGWVLLGAILELRPGLVVLAAVAGWLIGTAVALGAEPGTFRRQRSTVTLAVIVCLGTWLVGTYAAYLVSLTILPESALDLVGRMANAPFADLVATTFLPGGLLQLVAVAIFGWLGAR